MNEQSTYKTVKKRSEGLYKEKGSKFIGIVQACSSPEEAKSLLESWRKEHHQARHLCYAYCFGLDKSKTRANDDGEPSNSAGAPILGQITSFDLSNVLIGVVRYYGGTKLGVGGLINAYRTAAKEAIEHASIIELEVFEWVQLTFEYVDMPQVMNVIKRHKLEMRENDFQESCTVLISLKLSQAELIKQELEEFETVEIKIKGIY